MHCRAYYPPLMNKRLVTQHKLNRSNMIELDSPAVNNNDSQQLVLKKQPRIDPMTTTILVPLFCF